ncbi:hypothetical protein [Azospirillum baldaniorum]|uniref:hypothetical protein n=1 Tax=Azospirillum baldaniorum TaxID=1064539 RepID=UPI00119F2786|nr:hypothetical protein [Azospirillum baldaniorum]
MIEQPKGADPESRIPATPEACLGVTMAEKQSEPDEATEAAEAMARVGKILARQPVNPDHLTAWGQRAIEHGVLLAGLHLRRAGDRYAVYAGTAHVTVPLDAQEAAQVVMDLSGIAEDSATLAAIIETAVQPGAN